MTFNMKTNKIHSLVLALVAVLLVAVGCDRNPLTGSKGEESDRTRRTCGSEAAGGRAQGFSAAQLILRRAGPACQKNKKVVFMAPFRADFRVVPSLTLLQQPIRLNLGVCDVLFSIKS
jgi:hypothetical protein